MALLINKIIVNAGENHSRIDQNNSTSPMKAIIIKIAKGAIHTIQAAD